MPCRMLTAIPRCASAPPWCRACASAPGWTDFFFAGIFLAPVAGTSLAWIGLLLFAATAAFALVTLPVEFDASKRAKAALVGQGLVSPLEMVGVNSVLDAAALTYVAGAVQAVSTLLYYAFLLTGLRQQEE